MPRITGVGTVLFGKSIPDLGILLFVVSFRRAADTNCFSKPAIQSTEALLYYVTCGPSILGSDGGHGRRGEVVERG
jgi:hypothetical protein